MERKFVNPYTFVKFPESIVRSHPPGHTPSAEEAARRYTGSFKVTWTLKTPMVLPRDVDWGHVGGVVRIPGSSTKGAIRSVHETLFAGCPRELDAAFEPVYRDEIKPDLTRDWQLAVVSHTDSGTATEVRLCEQATDSQKGQGGGDGQVILEAKALRDAYPGLLANGPELSEDDLLPHTGDFVVPGDVLRSEHGRTQLDTPSRVTRLAAPS